MKCQIAKHSIGNQSHKQICFIFIFNSLALALALAHLLNIPSKIFKLFASIHHSKVIRSIFDSYFQTTTKKSQAFPSVVIKVRYNNDEKRFSEVHISLYNCTLKPLLTYDIFNKRNFLRFFLCH